MRLPFIMAVLLVNICVAAESATAPAIQPRVFVLTDVSNEPDDEGSLVRFLVYANESQPARVQRLIARAPTPSGRFE
jgi:hypothetical protein